MSGCPKLDMILSDLDILRLENTFTDIQIKVEEAEFLVLKCVLSAFSTYFKAMFTASLAKRIEKRIMNELYFQV